MKNPRNLETSFHRIPGTDVSTKVVLAALTVFFGSAFETAFGHRGNLGDDRRFEEGGHPLRSDGRISKSLV